MKKFIRKTLTGLLAVACVVTELSSASSAVYAKALKDSSIPIIKADNISAVMNYEYGGETELNAAPDIEEMEEAGKADELESYELYYEDEKILEVEVTNQVVNEPAGENSYDETSGADASTSTYIAGIGGGTDASAGENAQAQTGEEQEATSEVVTFYSSEFYIPDTTKQVYLTGLLSENIAEIQQLLIDAYVDGETFDITHASFIDVDKTYVDDKNLCWAATTAESLYYTGWGQVAGFTSEDEIFDLFVDAFTDNGGNNYWGFGWFFNGYIASYMPAKMTAGTGNYLPNYPYDEYSLTLSCSEKIYDMKEIQKALRAGSAVNLSIGSSEDSVSEFSHSIRCSGFINDTSYGTADIEYYDQLIIVDNENNDNYYTDRTKVANAYTVTSLSENTDDSYWHIDDLYGDGYSISINTAIILYAYSDEYESESSEDATRDFGTTTDLKAMGVNFMSNGEYSGDEIFYTGSDIGGEFLFYNISAYDYIGTCEADYVLKNSEGDSVCSGTLTFSFTLFKTGKYFSDEFTLATSELPAGDYTLTMTLNPRHTTAEAFYTNNVCNKNLTLVEGSMPKYGLQISMGEFDNGGHAIVSQTFTGLDDMPYGTKYSVHYYNRMLGNWVETDSYTSYNFDAVAEDFSIGKLGDSFKCIVDVYVPGMPTVRITSNEVALIYQSIYLAVGFSSTDEPTPLSNGASSLADGEAISFTIMNNSTNDAKSLTAHYYLVAEDDDGNRVNLTDEQTVAIAKGKMTAEISINSWKEGLGLTGTYGVYAIAYIEGESATQEKGLCYLRFKEAPGIVVDTSDDVVDDYDAVTSLREAVSYYEAQGLTDEAITFDVEAAGEVIYVDETICIDSHVKIDGLYTLEGDDNLYFTYLYSNTDDGDALFNVNAGATLDIAGVETANCPATFAVNGGELNIDKCILRTAHTSDGCVMSLDGANVTMSDSMLISTSLDKYGSIRAFGGTCLDVINCTFMDRSGIKGDDSAYFDVSDGATANIVTSTFVSYKRPTVVSSATVNMLSCIILNAGGATDISGNADLYGCFYGSTDEAVNVHEGCQAGTISDIFNVKNGYASYTQTSSSNSYYFFNYFLRPLTESGMRVDASGETLSYSYDGATYATDIGRAFDEVHYGLDAYGEERFDVYGSMNPEGAVSISAGMTIDEDLTLQIYGNVVGFAGDEDITPSMTVEFLGKTYNASDLVMDGRCCMYNFEGITPQYMGEDIAVTFTCESGGESVSVTKTLSIAGYLEALHTYYGEGYDEICAALLNYGRYTSLYYNNYFKGAEEPEASVLTMPSWASEIVGSGYEIDSASLVKSSTRGELYETYNTDDTTARISTASLRLGSQVKIMFFVKVKGVDVSTLSLKITGVATYTSDEWSFYETNDSGEDVYQIVLGGMSPLEFSDSVEAVLVGPSVVSGNMSSEADGGAIYNSADGGAIYNSADGEADGGAIYNSADGEADGGAIYNSADGGAIYNSADGGSGTQVTTGTIHSVTYSANDYCYNMSSDSNATLAGLARAIYIYGVATKKYNAG